MKKFVSILAIGCLSTWLLEPNFTHSQPLYTLDATQLSTLDAELTKASHHLETLRTHKEQLKAEIEQLEKRQEVLRNQVRERAYAVYRLTRPGILPVAGGYQALLDHFARTDRMEESLKRNLKSASWLDKRKLTLSKELSLLSKSLEEAKFNLEALQNRRNNAAIEARATDFFSAADQQDMTTFHTGKGIESGYGYIRYSDESSSHASTHRAASPFSEMMGHLPLPFSGQVQIQELALGHAGIELISTPGATVRAVAEGRVMYKGRHPETNGTMVILDHGERFYTVYAGMASLDVEMGDQVSKGARLGRLPAHSAQLRFEVRRGSRGLPARDWLGL